MAIDARSDPASEARRAAPWKWRALAWTLGTLVALEVALRVFVALTDPEHRLYTSDPNTGWITAPNLRIRFDVDKPPLHFLADTNTLGLRGDSDIPPKAPDELRIVVLGDSFTWGIGVESKETFPSALERRLRDKIARPIRVINAGMPSYGTEQELAFHRAYSEKLGADMVVLAFYVNDDGDNASRFLFSGGYLWQDPVLIFGQPSFLVELVVHRSLILAERAGWLSSPRKRDTRARTLELIRSLQDDCEAKGLPLFVLDIPSRETTRWVLPFENASKPRPLDLPPEILITMTYEVERQDESPYLLEHHFNPAGHELAASVLDRELTARAGRLLAGKVPR